MASQEKKGKRKPQKQFLLWFANKFEKKFEHLIQASLGGLARALRRAFTGQHPPFILVEGDSFFRMPLVNAGTTINHLRDSDEFTAEFISVAEAGDELEDMVKEKEYLKLIEQKGEWADAFLFSGGANKYLAKEADDLSLFSGFLKPYSDVQPSSTEPKDYLHESYINEILKDLKTNYETIIEDVHEIIPELPIIFGSYVCPYPYPWGENDPRQNKKHAKKDEWLGSVFNSADKGYPSGADENHELRRKIIKYLLEKLITVQKELADEHENVYIVDCLDLKFGLDEWFDEIHLNSKGSKKVAKRFKKKLEELDII